MRRFTAKRIAYIAVMTAVALILHVAESMLPPLLPFAPNAKIGLANAASLFALAVFGFTDALIVLVARCLLGSFFSANIGTGIIYSLSGGLASFALSAVLYTLVFPRVSLLSISVVGASVHNIVQLLIASLMVGQSRVLYLLPLNIAASFLAGIFIGVTVHYLIKYLPKALFRVSG